MIKQLIPIVVLSLVTVSVRVVLSAAPAQAENNGAASTPPMGWSSWSSIRTNPTEANIEAQAAALVTSGLRDSGYTYVNVDDFWYRNPSVTVDTYGRWVTDSTRFPNGMAAVGSYVHSLGLKFGMYVTPGIPVAAWMQNTAIEGTSFHARDIVSDTNSREVNYNFGSSMYYIDFNKNPVAAQAFLNSWAGQLASYGIDFLKIDGVGAWDIPDIQHWSAALNQTGRTIHLALSNTLDVNDAGIWQTYANSWRIEGDVECYCDTVTDWGHIVARLIDAPRWSQYAGLGGWNDLDSVEVGNGDSVGLNATERKTQLTLWAISAAPLLLGTDLTHLDSTDLALLTNSEVIAVDRSGRAAHPLDTTTRVWSVLNADGSYTVALFNASDSYQMVGTRWSDLGFVGDASVRDLWSHTSFNTGSGGYAVQLPPHGSALIKVTPLPGWHYSTLRYEVKSVFTGQLLGINGDNVEAQTYDARSDQEWQLVPTDGGFWKIVNVFSGKALALPGETRTPGVHLTEVEDTVDPQIQFQWRVNARDGARYVITARASGQAMDLSSGSPAVVQQPVSGAQTQLWELIPIPVPGTRYKLISSATGGRMDVYNDSMSDAAKIVQFSDNQQTDQLWTFTHLTSGYTIANVNSGKLLNIPGPTTSPGTQLIQYHDDGKNNSRWILLDAGPNQIRITSAYDGQLVDLSGGSSNNDNPIIQWTDNGGANQRWILSAAG